MRGTTRVATQTGLALSSMVLALGVLGCPAARPMVTVRVQSGLRAGLEIGYVEARLVRGSVSCTSDASAIGVEGIPLTTGDQGALGAGSLTVAEFRDLEPGVYTVRARFRRPPVDETLSADSGPVLVERCALTTLAASRVVRIALTTDCLEVECPGPGGDPAYSECLNGRCVAPGCDPDDASSSPLCCDRTEPGVDCDAVDALCDADADCPPVTDCALARRCIDGVCVEPDTDRCPDGQYCSALDDGCVSEGASVRDAGQADARPIDATSPLDAQADAAAPDAGAPDAYVATCGFDGLPCCDGVSCEPGSACTAGTCRGCGGIGSPCCGGGVCGVGVCLEEVCAPCGGIGERCCAGSSCTSGVCSAGSCVACGGIGQPCCGTSCTSGVCSAGSCVACGGIGQPCCGGACTAGACSGGSCVACGERGQPCCGGGACAAFAYCNGGTCTGCGGFFEMCCPGGGCISELGCEGGWCSCHGYAESCDTIPCCPGGGLECGGSSGGGCCATRDQPCNPAHGSIYCCGSDWCCDIGGGDGRCRPAGSC